jgi:hypothetical protein
MQHANYPYPYTKDLEAGSCQVSLDTRRSNFAIVIGLGHHESMTNADTEVTIYLLHFDRPYKGKMRHYLGFTNNLDNRLENHRRGTACVTTKRAFDRGIGFVLARTWLGPIRLERSIKRHGVVRSCPICTPSSAATLPRPTEQVPMVLP